MGAVLFLIPTPREIKQTKYQTWKLDGGHVWACPRFVLLYGCERRGNVASLTTTAMITVN